MADIAKLGIEIDASSVVKAKGEMQSFGQTATKAASDTETSISRMEARFAQLPGGIARAQASMASLTSGKLSSPFVVDLDKQNQSIAAFESNARRLANVRLDEALAKSATAATVAGQAIQTTGGHAAGMALIFEHTATATQAFGDKSFLVSRVLAAMGPAGIAVGAGVIIAASAYKVATAAGDAMNDTWTKTADLIHENDFGKMAAQAEVLRLKIDSREGLTGAFNQYFQTLKGYLTHDENSLSTEELLKQKGALDESAWLKQKHAISEVSASVRDQIRLVGIEAPEALRIEGEALERDLIQKYAKAGAGWKDAAEKAKALANELTGAKLNEYSKTQAKEQAAIQGQIDAADIRIAKIGVTGDALLKLTLAETLHNNSMNESLQKHSALAQIVDQRAIAESNLARATAAIDRGKSAVTEFESQFGVKFDTDQSAQQLAGSFANVFNTYKNDPSKQKPLADAFNSFVSQAAAMGTENISGLLQSVNIDPANIQRLRDQLKSITTGFTTEMEEQVTFKTNVFGGRERTTEMVEKQVPIVNDLRKAFDDSDSSVKNWGATVDTQAKLAVQQYGAVGKAVDDTNQKAADLAATVARGMAANLDNSQPRTAIQEIHTWLDGIPLVTYRSIEFKTFASGSPTKPFSEYFDTYMPSKIASIGDITPEIAVQIPDYSKRVREIDELTSRIGAFQQTAANKYGFHFEAANADFAERQIKNLSPQLQDAQFNLAADVYRAQKQGAAPNDSGGGASSVAVNIDLSGATLSREFLDDELIPALERGVIRATGKDPNLRVFS